MIHLLIFFFCLSATCGFAAQTYETGGPLAGVALPLFPTQHGEPPGYPGVLPGTTVKIGDKDVVCDAEGLAPERLLHPDSVEHWRANDFKYLPVRSLFDRQSLVKNWRAGELPGVDPGRIESYAEPVYWVRRHRNPVMTDRTLKPVPVVRVKPGAPAFTLDCGVLEPGMYMISVVGAVETHEIIRHRKPLILKLTVNDGLDGTSSRYRLRCGYVDQFYSVAEIYFHAPERRAYTATLQSGQGSLVPLLVHNIELHDVLAGRERRAIKTRMTWNDPREQAALVQDDLSAGERLARDRKLWESGVPLNAQLGIIYGMGSNDAKSNWPNLSADGKNRKEIVAEYGKWEAGSGAILAVNKKLDLEYTLADYRSGKPLPAPYPFKDNGTGLWYPPAEPGEKPQNWLPVASAVQDKIKQSNRWLNGRVSTYWRKGSLKAGRDAAILLAYNAYNAPAMGMHQGLSTLIVQPGAWHKDQRHRARYFLRGRLDPYVYFDAYDKLFPLISTDKQIAESLGRFIPWIKTPADVVQLMDVYLVQEKAKRYMRYHQMDNNNPAFMATVVAMLGDRAVTDPWMEWQFTRTWMYPLSVSGLADVIISGNDRDGAKFIGSLYYAHVENASTSGEMLEQAIEAGANPRYDLRDPRRYPKTVAACNWFLDVRLAGLWYPRVGDVCGPSATYGHWITRQNMEAGIRRGWRWTEDPKFAWMLKHVYGRKEMTDAEWTAVEAAAATQDRAPWTLNRSRVLPNWFGALETGTEYDDYRFRRSAYLRIGQGYGHAHADTLDLGIYAHGLPMTTEGGQRPGYSRPADNQSKVHNLVEVNERNWQGHSWVSALSDAEGARYVAAATVPPSGFSGVSSRQRQMALIDVTAVQGARPLSPREMHPDYKRLKANIVTPNSYVFDVNRIAGGKIYTYCFNGNSEDELVVNLEKRETIDQLTADEKSYLDDYPDPAKCFGGDAPETLVATWRLNRADFKGAKSYGPEQMHARFPWSDDLPRKYTRLHLLEQKGARVLAGEYYCHAGNNGFTVLHARHAPDQATDRVFTAIIEPFVGQPFIDGVRTLPVTDNETDARKAVAVEVKTKNGHVDWLFTDGRPEKTRELGGQRSGVKISGEFGYLSRDAAGIRLAALTGGRLLQAEDIILKPMAAEYTGTVTAINYLDKQLEIDTAWPAGALLQGRVFEIGTGDHWTTCTLTDSTPQGKGSMLTVQRGADFYLARVLEVDAEQRLVTCNMGLAFQGGGVVPGLDKNWVASDEDGRKFWRAEYLGPNRNEGRYTFKLTGGPVAQEDFGRRQGFRLWWYGVGDTVRQSTFVSLRRIEPGLYELTADTAVTLGLTAKMLETSPDRETWTALPTRSENGLRLTDISLARLDARGRGFIRVR